MPADNEATVGQLFSLTFSAVDPRGEPLIFSITGKPPWAAFESSTGRLAGTPSQADIGTYANIRISASNGRLESQSNPFSVTVKALPEPPPPPPPADSPPTISGTPPTRVAEGQAYAFVPSAADPDNDALTFSISNKPFWASFNAATGALTGTPTVGAAGLFPDIVISVSDGTRSVSLPAFTLVVEAINRAPVIAGNPLTVVREATAYYFRPVASDADGHALAFSIAGKPAWASFNVATGELAGTPLAGSAGSYGNIVISVSDGAVSSSLPAFTITVTADRGPTIAGTPASQVTVGQTYSFTPVAADADGDALVFSIRNLPPWATFSTSTGRLSGTPDAGAVGEYIDIVISVHDGFVSASLPAFSIAVEQANRPPIISGTPTTTVLEGQYYSFQPAASDPDGDSLDFVIVNKPSWARFSSDGNLSGTPPPGSAGTYADIRILVRDGRLTAALPSFSIEVRVTAIGTATLQWSAPTTRSNETPLTDLAGYRIYYGTEPGWYPNTITIDNPGITTYVLENLPPGTHYFAATAFDTTGGESDLSNMVSKTIQ